MLSDAAIALCSAVRFGHVAHGHQQSFGKSYTVQALSDAAIALCSADIKYVAISARISTYADYIAAAERLLKQPIPTAFTRQGSLAGPLARLRPVVPIDVCC